MHKEITIGNFPAYHAYPDDGQKHPGLIVIHEIWGLADHIKSVADRFVAQGFSVVAPNLFHDMAFESALDPQLFNEMQNPETRDAAQQKLRALMAPLRSPEYAQSAIVKLKECVDFLLAHEHCNGKVAVLGFCFGGTYAFQLAALDPRIKAAVPFYGQAPAAENIAGISCPVLAFYGDQDAPLMQTLPQLKEQMQAEGKQFEAVVYPETGHAFFNDTNKKMYRPGPAEDAWNRTLEFLRKNLDS